MQLSMSGKGNDAPGGGIPGDLLILIEEVEDKELKRDGNNIVYDLHISFVDAALGTSVEVPTIDGKAKIKIGGAVSNLKKLPLNLTADVTVPNDNSAYVSLGSEYWFKDLIAIRLGYAGSKDESKGVRVGVGLKYSSLLFDYAYAGVGDFGATNRVSLSLRFGDKIRQLNADERAMSVTRTEM